MDYSFVMSVLESFEYLNNKMESLFPVNYFLTLYIFFQRNALDVLHYDILQVFAEADIVNLNDIGVRQHGNDL